MSKISKATKRKRDIHRKYVLYVVTYILLYFYVNLFFNLQKNPDKNSVNILSNENVGIKYMYQNNIPEIWKINHLELIEI